MTESSKEIFSFHLVKIPLIKVPQFLLCPMTKKKIAGLNHAESFFTMNLGNPITSTSRYNLNAMAFLAWWQEEYFLEKFLTQPTHQFLRNDWHVRLKLYRKWGEVSELKNATVCANLLTPDKPIIAITLARLNLFHTHRFVRWGRPVESQVRNHKGQVLALAALRPLNTFSTFSVWKNESEMLNMVHGKNKLYDGEDHKLAMQERIRKDFHNEFTTMRFTPLKEVGIWNGKSGFTL